MLFAVNGSIIKKRGKHAAKLERHHIEKYAKAALAALQPSTDNMKGGE